jgi:hypothetical protein
VVAYAARSAGVDLTSGARDVLIRERWLQDRGGARNATSNLCPGTTHAMPRCTDLLWRQWGPNSVDIVGAEPYLRWLGRAQVAELVDALDSGSSGRFARGSSSLLLGTIT